MKGAVSADDETRLSFQVATIDTGDAAADRARVPVERRTRRAVAAGASRNRVSVTISAQKTVFSCDLAHRIRGVTRADAIPRQPSRLRRQPSALDDLRAAEYGRLDAQGIVYLDYTGGGLHADSQVREHAELLERARVRQPALGQPELDGDDQRGRARARARCSTTSTAPATTPPSSR